MKKSLYLFILLCSLITTPSFSQITTLLNFDGPTNGSYPQEYLLSDGTFLYGMSMYGGANNLGTVFKIKSDGTGYVTLLDFSGNTNGSLPHGSLITDGTYLYGMTQEGGTNDLGTVFKIMPDGTGYSKLLDFDGSNNGSYPNSTLYSDGTFLYGTTGSGGVNGMGVIFKIMADGTGYQKLIDFNGTNGFAPEGPLISDGTYLYGICPGGGTGNLGTIYRILPDGTGFLTLKNFNGGTLGSTPRGTLVSDGTFLYGMTSYGGTDGKGIIFKVKFNGTSFVNIHDFTGTPDGSTPVSSLVFSSNYLVGMTQFGGVNDLGTIFRILPDGSGYQKLFDFDGTANGSKPNGSLIINGSIAYGSTEYGGTNDVGTLFSFDLSVGLTESTMNSEFQLYPNPSTGSFSISASFNGDQIITVSNLLGEIVHIQRSSFAENKAISVDLKGMEKGVYNVRIGDLTKRLIIK